MMKKNKSIIALFGVHGVGKDTVAAILKELLGGKENVEIKSFAEPVQKAVASLLDVMLDKIKSHSFKDSPSGIVSYVVGENPFSNLEDAQEFQKELLKEGYDLKLREYKITPRDLVIEIAERLKEAFGDGIWAKIAMKKAKKEGNVIFTDLRFKSELKELKKENALIVKVVCEDENGKEMKGDLYEMEDFPEEEIDYVIYNKKDDWSHLRAEILRMIEKLKL
jgi:hypothetical protein